MVVKSCECTANSEDSLWDPTESVHCAANAAVQARVGAAAWLLHICQRHIYIIARFAFVSCVQSVCSVCVCVSESADAGDTQHSRDGTIKLMPPSKARHHLFVR